MRLGGERGQSSPEYLGILVLVGLIIAALVATAVPQQIASAIERVVCMLAGGGDCGGTEVAAPDDPGSEEVLPCTTSSSVDEFTATTDWMFDRDLWGTRYMVEERSNGVTEVRDIEYSGSGNVVSLGGELPVGKGKVGVSGTGSTVEIEEEGRVYVLDSDEERDTYARARALPYIEVYMGGPEEALRWEFDPDFPKRDSWEALMIGLSDRHYVRLGGNASLTLGAGAKGLYGGVTVSGSSGTVVEEDGRTGETITSFDVSAEATGELGVMLLGGPTAAANGRLVVSLHQNEAGEITRISVTSTAGASGGGQLKFDVASLADLPAAINANAGVSSGEESGASLRVTASLDLTDPETRAAALAFAENPGLQTGGDLAGRLDDSGTVLAELFTTDVSNDHAGLGIGAGPVIGTYTDERVTEMRLADAWSWDPVNGARHRSDCTG